MGAGEGKSDGAKGRAEPAFAGLYVGGRTHSGAFDSLGGTTRHGIVTAAYAYRRKVGKSK